MEGGVQYWDQRWQAEDAPWHKTSVNRFLQDYFNRVSEIKDGSCRIFVPLCGKTLDMKWHVITI